MRTSDAFPVTASMSVRQFHAMKLGDRLDEVDNVILILSQPKPYRRTRKAIG
jgi:hypothetical protein